MSDAVYYTTESVDQEAAFAYDTAVADEEIAVVYKKKNGETRSAGQKFKVKHNAALSAMFAEFMGMKFNSVADSDAPIKVRLQLVDISVESQDQNSGGRQFAAAMFGGELQSAKRVRQKAVLTVSDVNGESHEKTLVASSSTSDVDGIGTGTSSSNIYKGQNADHMIFGRLLNDANNKIIMQAGKYIDSLEL